MDCPTAVLWASDSVGHQRVPSPVQRPTCRTFSHEGLATTSRSRALQRYTVNHRPNNSNGPGDYDVTYLVTPVA